MTNRIYTSQLLPYCRRAINTNKQSAHRWRHEDDTRVSQWSSRDDIVCSWPHVGDRTRSTADLGDPESLCEATRYGDRTEEFNTVTGEQRVEWRHLFSNGGESRNTPQHQPEWHNSIFDVSVVAVFYFLILEGVFFIGWGCFWADMRWGRKVMSLTRLLF